MQNSLGHLNKVGKNMNKVDISKWQRRGIVLFIIASFIAIIAWRLTVDEKPGGKYSVTVVTPNQIDISLRGTADIVYNSNIDKGNFYLQKIKLISGKKLYFYGETTPLNFNKKNMVFDDEDKLWGVYVGERVDQLGFWQKLFTILPNLLLWCIIIFLFSIRSFIDDIVSILEVKTEEMHSLDKKAMTWGQRLENWRNHVENMDRFSDACKLIAIFVAILWFLHQYRVI